MVELDAVALMVGDMEMVEVIKRTSSHGLSREGLSAEQWPPALTPTITGAVTRFGLLSRVAPRLPDRSHEAECSCCGVQHLLVVEGRLAVNVVGSIPAWPELFVSLRNVPQPNPLHATTHNYRPSTHA